MASPPLLCAARSLLFAAYFVDYRLARLTRSLLHKNPSRFMLKRRFDQPTGSEPEQCLRLQDRPRGRPEDPEGIDTPEVDRIVRRLELGRRSSQRSSGSTAPPSSDPTA